LTNPDDGNPWLHVAQVFLTWQGGRLGLQKWLHYSSKNTHVGRFATGFITRHKCNVLHIYNCIFVHEVYPERKYRNKEATATAAPLFAGTVRHHQLVGPGFFLLVYLNGNFISNNVLSLQFSRKTLSFYAMGQSPTFS
jgi:hypothetical protein